MATDEQDQSSAIPVVLTPESSTLAQLLITWQGWSDRAALARQILQARAVGNAQQVAALTRALHTVATIKPLDALTANHQLVQLLVAVQPQAIRAARKDGASWDQIATALDTSAEQACAEWLAHQEGSPQKVEINNSR